MAILEVVLSQLYSSQNTINRWNYVSTGTPAAVTLSFALAKALGAIFDETLLGGSYPASGLMCILANMQNNGCLFTGLSVRNVYSETDFYETPFAPPLVGANGGDGNSPMMAIGFRSNRITTLVRRGTKRFTAVPEAFVGQGGEVAIGSGGNVDAVRVAMNAVLTYNDEGNNLTFAPAVCGKEKYPVMKDGVPTGTHAYRYYADPAVQLEHTAVGVTWEAYPVVRGQQSRQYGRGR